MARREVLLMSNFLYRYLDPHLYTVIEEEELRARCGGLCPPEAFTGCEHILLDDKVPTRAIYWPGVEMVRIMDPHLRGLCGACFREQVMRERFKMACAQCEKYRPLAEHYVVSFLASQSCVKVVCPPCRRREAFQKEEWEEIRSLIQNQTPSRRTKRNLHLH
jgi:hypothetical protein